jgi:hypothetical protein
MVLLTTLNNVGSKTLFSPVYFNPEQAEEADQHPRIALVLP